MKLIPSFLSTLSASIYVDKTGSDSNLGTDASPFLTIGKAKSVAKTTPNNVDVFIGGGVYEERLDFDISDKVGGIVSYKASDPLDKPIVSAGKAITSITDNGGVWNWSDNSIAGDIWVNDTRSQRARYPNTNYVRPTSVSQTASVGGLVTTTLGFDSNTINLLDALTPSELARVNFRWISHWDTYLWPVDSVNSTNNTIQCTAREISDYLDITTSKDCYFDMVANALDTGGEWYSDGTTYSYIPRSGETIANSSVVISSNDRMMTIKGDINNFAGNLSFNNIQFRYGNTVFDKVNYDGFQASVYVDPNIELYFAKNIEFTDCEIQHTGAHGFYAKEGCEYITISRMYLDDLGAGGIYIGGLDWGGATPEDLRWANHITIDNCILRNGGFNYESGVGMASFAANNITMTYNDIGYFKYSGISCGWQWSWWVYQATAFDNIIRYNHVHDIMYDNIVSDGGGIYTLGPQQGTFIEYNVIHDVGGRSLGTGIYHDQASTYITNRYNLIYDIRQRGINQSTTEVGNDIENNVVAYADLASISIRVIEYDSTYRGDFLTNIMLIDIGDLITGDVDAVPQLFEHNVWFNENNPDPTFSNSDMTWAEWQASGRDVNGLLQSGGVLDRVNRDFIVDSGVAAAIGWVDVDWSTVGVYGKQDWIDKGEL